ncbi:MAG: hypothetical protein O2973_07780 [Gemmatimonadetes bacterium]|nr:hypothetical protein [Gemmatimonadota bacterium]
MRRAFGLKGELFVAPTTNEPGEVFAPGRLVNATVESVNESGVAASDLPRGLSDGRGNPVARDCVIERSRPFKDGWLLKLDSVDDKTEADRWRGVTLSVPFADLTPPAGNELYLRELTGMAVRDEPHGELGVVAGWYELPQGLVLEVRGPEWRADVPFNDAFVERVDREARVIAVKLPDGLLEAAD